MSPRPAGRSAACTTADARARLHDAEAFLETAHLATDADVIATLAIHAAIAAADAICCVALRERSTDGNHAAAAELLGRVDTKLANALSRTLNRKTQAAYESRDIAGETPPCASGKRQPLSTRRGVECTPSEGPRSQRRRATLTSG